VFYVIIAERIKNENSLKQCCGSWMFIPDPNFSILGPGSRVRKFPDLGSRVRKIPDPESERFRIPDPESVRFRIPDLDPHKRI
jgi:hypothetical protein